MRFFNTIGPVDACGITPYRRLARIDRDDVLLLIA